MLVLYKLQSNLLKDCYGPEFTTLHFVLCLHFQWNKLHHSHPLSLPFLSWNKLLACTLWYWHSRPSTAISPPLIDFMYLMMVISNNVAKKHRACDSQRLSVIFLEGYRNGKIQFCFLDSALCYCWQSLDYNMIGSMNLLETKYSFLSSEYFWSC